MESSNRVANSWIAPEKPVCDTLTYSISAKLTFHHKGVKHLVFSSVAGADIAKPVEHFYTKYHLEEYIRESGLGWTIIRPVGFMEVIPPPGIGRLLFLSAIATLMGNTQQRYVACDDIGKAVATTLIRPEKYVGKTVTICGQVATVDELEASLEKGEAQKGWGRIWMPRWLVIRMTPYHYRHMFDASCQVSQYLPWGDLLMRSSGCTMITVSRVA